ncbi:MAG: penicillin acylase family protein, partial [Merismopedia sp. SIO2A8]|nr:penicillin acylase family protein [Merismopedia sp. SIO2A8]
MQADVYSPAIAQLKPLMVEAARKAGDRHSAILDRLVGWDNQMVM